VQLLQLRGARLLPGTSLVLQEVTSKITAIDSSANKYFFISFFFLSQNFQSQQNFLGGCGSPTGVAAGKQAGWLLSTTKNWVLGVLSVLFHNILI